MHHDCARKGAEKKGDLFAAEARIKADINRQFITEGVGE